LKKAFPALTLVGVDHWQGSTGLHDSSIDDFLLFPQWKQIDDEIHAEEIRAILDEDHLWISALDMEVHWLSKNLGPHANLIAPGGPTLELSSKPAVRGLEELGYAVPEFISASLPDSEIHAFLRHSSWRCWLKSPYHDALRISSWGGFERARAALKESWETSRLFLQRHVTGNEETIAFGAYRGELVGAAHLQKRQLTPEGKTWAGRVTPLDPEVFEKLRHVVRQMEWNGGGEVEYLRDSDGQAWIIECNPRFPAWIYGATLAGHNLVARLVSRIWDLPFLDRAVNFPFFARVVQEIPAKESIGLPLPPDPGSLAWVGEGKKGKGSSLGLIFASLRENEDEEEDTGPEQEPERLPPGYIAEVSALAKSFEGETPARIHLENWTRARFAELGTKARGASVHTPPVLIGYSVKTSPTDEHLRKAREEGFLAECISQAEVRRALDFGYRAEEVILNGPGKFWPITRPPVMGLAAVYCDSVEEFERVVGQGGMARTVGFRIRLPQLPSRFGNPIDEFESFRKIAQLVREHGRASDLGFHFHMPSWAIGVDRWMASLESLLMWCQAFERLSEVPVKDLDLGGGFFPGDLAKLDFTSIQERVASELPRARALYFEPGRSLTQDGDILVSRVLDVRRTPKGRPAEIVVDACIAELPLALSFTHRVFFRQGSAAPRPLAKGRTRVLGRICMEDDILSPGLDFPDDVAIGDLVIFGDAGGYERTMSYVFGRG
jgi:diaminopimelate decarboxylase